MASGEFRIIIYIKMFNNNEATFKTTRRFYSLPFSHSFSPQLSSLSHKCPYQVSPELRTGVSGCACADVSLPLTVAIPHFLRVASLRPCFSSDGYVPAWQFPRGLRAPSTLACSLPRCRQSVAGPSLDALLGCQNDPFCVLFF